MMMMITITIIIIIIVTIYFVVSTNNHWQMLTLNEYLNASFISGLSVIVLLSAAFGGVNCQQTLRPTE
jgi:uncharacterized membrane protein YesL